MRITELASRDVSNAISLAATGFELTEIQDKLHRYYLCKFECEQSEKGIRGQISKALEASSGKVWDEKTIEFLNNQISILGAGILDDLTHLFRNAINSGDSAKIVEIGKGIDFLRSIAGKTGDKIRADILFLKYRLDQRGEKWPIRKLAETIGWPDMSGADGFSTLRKICKSLDFPIKPIKANKA